MKLFVYNTHGDMTDSIAMVPDKNSAQLQFDVMHKCNPKKYAKAIYYTGHTKEPLEPSKPKKAMLKKLRDLSGLSQKAFGKKYGIPVRTIENWESGEREMPDYVLDLLEKAVWEDKDKTYLTWAVIYKREDEFITPCASKADALEVGQDEYDRLTSQEKKNADHLYVGLCNLDEHGDWRELEDGTIDADVREVAKEWI